MTATRRTVLSLGLGALATSSARADVPAPIVVELFQSQGCSSCPPANANINQLAGRPDLIVLSYGVTYWDHLGWRDTFASPAFTRRQWDYARGLSHRNVATPQVVINGLRDVTGINNATLLQAIGAAPRVGVILSEAAGFIEVHGAPPPSAVQHEVLLVRYDPRVQQVPVRRGENAGRTLPHRNIVRELTRLGGWTPASTRFHAPAARDPALRSVILVQTPGGPIITATRLSPPRRSHRGRPSG